MNSFTNLALSEILRIYRQLRDTALAAAFLKTSCIE